MLSRVADSLYWMSRYVERTDGILRMLRINYASSQDHLQDFSWEPVLRIFSYLREDRVKEIAPNSRAVLQYMVTDRDNSNSVHNMVTHARENARSVQDHITKELWQCLNVFYHTIREDQVVRGLNDDDPISILDVLIRQGVLYYGITDITMARGEGYAFLNIGKFIERGVQSADILDVRFSDLRFDSARTDPTYWKYLLMSISGYEYYLKTYRSGFDARNVVEQIVLSPNFPRSILYSVSRLQLHFQRLKGDGNREAFTQIDFMIGKIHSKVRYSTVESILSQGLHAYLIGIKEDLYSVGNALNQHYFAYS
jgi:uncharacterized alpha-E superfamily protein